MKFQMSTTKTYVKFPLLRICITFILSLWVCGQSGSVSQEEELKPTIILISLDGFRWDYMDRTDTPNLDYLADHGVKAKSLIPVFPTTTFPNHLSIITGLYPENHGIVSNTMYDKEFDALYTIGEGSESVTESRWYEGEPIWVTAEKQGRMTATYFWPASEAEISGERPTYWYTYDGSIPNDDRVDQVLAWLDLPDDERPVFITVYFNDTNYWGHIYGPEATEMDGVIQGVDGYIGRLLDGLRERDLLDELNIIIASDHGMVETSQHQVIFIDDYINLNDVMMVTWSPVASIRPGDGMEDSIYNALSGAHPKLSVYRKQEVPARLHYRNHRRITPIICISDEGWSITTHSYFDNHPDAYTGGTHGYDPIYTSMHGIFIASGPAFKNGVTVPSFQNIHIYDLMAHVLELEPAQNDGSLDSVRAMLR